MGVKNMANEKLAAILSFLIPGLGQAYAGALEKGIIFFVIELILGIIIVYVLGSASWAYIIIFIYAIYAAYNAYKIVDSNDIN